MLLENLSGWVQIDLAMCLNVHIITSMAAPDILSSCKVHVKVKGKEAINTSLQPLCDDRQLLLQRVVYGGQEIASLSARWKEIDDLEDGATISIFLKSPPNMVTHPNLYIFHHISSLFLPL